MLRPALSSATRCVLVRWKPALSLLPPTLPPTAVRTPFLGVSGYVSTSARSLCSTTTSSSSSSSSSSTILDTLKQAASTASGKPVGGLAALPSPEDCVAAIEASLQTSNPTELALSLVTLVTDRGCRVKFTPELAAACLKAAVVCKSPDVMVTVATCMERTRTSPARAWFEVEAALSALMDAGRFESALHLFDILLRNDVSPTEPVVMKAAAAYAHVGQTESAIRLFRELVAADASCLDLDWYSDMVLTLSASGHDDLVLEVFSAVQERNGRLTDPAIAAVIAIVCNSPRDLKRAFAFGLRTGRLRQSFHTVVGTLSSIPDTNALSALHSVIRRTAALPKPDLPAARRGAEVLLCAYSRSGNFGRAMGMWDLMVELQLERRTSCATCVEWISALVKAGKPWEALAVFDRILAADVQPDEFMFSAVISACGRANDYERAKKLWRALQRTQGRRQGVQPNVVCYDAMLHAAARCAQRTDAFNLLDDMRLKGLRPTAQSYTSLISACTATNSTHQAFSVYDDMLVNGVDPNEHVFTALLSACTRAASMELTIEAVGLMEAEDIQPTVKHYGLMISAARKARDEVAGYRWLQGLRDAHGAATASQFEDVVFLCGWAPNVDRAEEVYKQALADGVGPTPKLILNLARAHARAFDLDTAFKLLDRFRRLKYSPLAKGYNHIIRQCGTEEYLPKAVELVEELARTSSKPTTVTFTALAAACVDAGNVEMAVDVLPRMRRSRTPANAALFNVLLAGCVAQDRPELADKVVAAMDESGVRPTPQTFEILQGTTAAEK